MKSPLWYYQNIVRQKIIQSELSAASPKRFPIPVNLIYYHYLLCNYPGRKNKRQYPVNDKWNTNHPINNTIIKEYNYSTKNI